MRVLVGLVRRTALFAMSGIFAACSNAADTRMVLPPPPAFLDVKMREHRFEHQVGVPAGRVVIRARNEGRGPHQILLVRLPADLPGTLDEQLHSPTRRPVESLFMLPNVASGDGGVFAVDLPPGRYGFICFLQDPDGTTHALKGMNSDLRAEDPRVPPSAPPQAR